MLPRTQTLTISAATTTISHLDYCSSLFSPSSVLTGVREVLLTSKSQPVTPLFTALSWLLSHSESKSLQDQKKAYSVWPAFPLFSSPAIVLLLLPFQYCHTPFSSSTLPGTLQPQDLSPRLFPLSGSLLRSSSQS